MRRAKLRSSGVCVQQLESRQLLSAAHGLTGEYFLGDDFQTPTMVRTDTHPSFNWKKYNAPDQLFIGQQYSVLDAGTLTPTTGDIYTFYLPSNSGTRLIINGTTLIDNFTSRVNSTPTASIALQAGQQYTIELEYVSGGAGRDFMSLQWSAAGVAKQVIPAADLTPDASIGLPDEPLVGTYYAGENFQTAVMTRADPNIDFNWPFGNPDQILPTHQGFSVDWQGTVVPSYSETYTFQTRTDDGVRLIINGQDVINQWHDQGATVYSARVALTAGVPVTVEMEYYANDKATSTAQLYWQSASQAKEIVPFGTTLAAPTLTASTSSNTQIGLSWTDVSGETGFVLQRSTDLVHFTTVATVGAGVTSYTDTGLSPGSTYFYQVATESAAGQGIFSSTASATTLASAATNLSASAASDTEINLSWTAAPGAAGYVIEESSNGSAFSPVTTVGATASSYAIGGLNPSTAYSFEIVATNSAGASSATSNQAGATTNTVAPAYASLTTLFGLGADSNVYSIDPATGNQTQIGSLAFATNAGGRSPADGLFYYISTDPSNAALATWDPNTNTNNTLSATVAVSGTVSRAAFRSDGLLFFTDAGNNVYVFNTTTQTATVIGVINSGGSALPSSTGDIAFDPSGNLYLCTNSTLYEITSSDLATAVTNANASAVINASEIGATGTGDLQIAFGQSGVLYDTDPSGSLFIVDLNSGVASQVGTATGEPMGDLASVPAYAGLSVTQIASTLAAGQNGSYQLNVANSGPQATVGPITLVDTLPAGISFVSGSGNGWTFNVSGSTVTATYTPSLAVGGVAPTVILTVAVSPSASGTVTNTVTVSTNIFDTDASDNTSVLMSTIVP